MNEDILTVSDLNAIIKTSLKEALPDLITITGELFNYKKSGPHIYASIRDSNSSLSLIQWKAPKTYSNGDAIIVSGYIEFYSKNSNVNFIAKQIKLDGDTKGSLYKIIDDTKFKYEAKGYFDLSKKKIFPQTLNKIALITSVNGAALQDIIYVLTQGKFPAHILVKNCLVQGADSPSSIAESIQSLSESYPELDLIMITRGGGSIEDLMAFSDPLVIEAIYESNIFTMSAVGHQIDSMLSDFVADISAPTPSIGAELLVKSSMVNTNKLILLQSKQLMLKDIILNKLKSIKKTRYEMVYLFQQNKIKSLQKKMLLTIQSKISFLKTESEKLKLRLDSYKKSQYNCNLLKNNILVTDVDDITIGSYTLILNNCKINIEISSIS